jgi:hypothetical protein
MTSKRSFDGRSFAIMLVTTLLGAAWAYFNWVSAGGARVDATVRPLVWAIFATPAALCIGWLIARRVEWALAAFCCFCLYFLTPFVAARIESLLVPAEQIGTHEFYFGTVIVLHLLAGSAMAAWRALSPPVAAGAAHEPVEATGN